MQLEQHLHADAWGVHLQGGPVIPIPRLVFKAEQTKGVSEKLGYLIGALIIRILLFRVLYSGSPFSETPIFHLFKLWALSISVADSLQTP